ncbi:MAG: undecaprenyl-phosphate glucose phosphotransferase [Chloroflexota bacterium]|nr:MAG: undecaprenyl-phosphate glucose phosphotransferase [Chloroflexota bacterium]
MKRRIGTIAIVALMLADLLTANAALFVAHYIRFVSGAIGYEELHPLRSYLGMGIIQMVAIPAVFAAHRLYRLRRHVAPLDQLYGVFSAYSITTVLVMVVSALIWRDFGPSRLLVAILWALGIAFVFAGRLVTFALLSVVRARGISEERLLVVGAGDAARLVIERIRHRPRLGYRPVGCLIASEFERDAAPAPVLGSIADLAEVIPAHRVDEVIVAMPSLSHEQLVEIVSYCQGERVNIRVYPDLFQMLSAGVETLDLSGLPLLTIRDSALRGWNVIVKRAMDIVGSAAILIVLSLPMLVIALLVRLSSAGGSVFYIQERVGLDGRPFHCLKFRSMRADAETASGPVWASTDDPRRTTIGAMLRRFSLDELPQFINVLIGEMSLVGPRPERPYFVDQFRQSVPRYWDRHREKAGITGWAQVNGLRGNTSIEERTTYDLWYVENWTPWLDIKILLRTPFAAISDKNAY